MVAHCTAAALGSPPRRSLAKFKLTNVRSVREQSPLPSVLGGQHEHQRRPRRPRLDGVLRRQEGAPGDRERGARDRDRVAGGVPSHRVFEALEDDHPPGGGLHDGEERGEALGQGQVHGARHRRREEAPHREQNMERGAAPHDVLPRAAGEVSDVEGVRVKGLVFKEHETRVFSPTAITLGQERAKPRIRVALKRKSCE
jgi:hypothetical protein